MARWLNNTRAHRLLRICRLLRPVSQHGCMLKPGTLSPGSGVVKPTCDAVAAAPGGVAASKSSLARPALPEPAEPVEPPPKRRKVACQPAAPAWPDAMLSAGLPRRLVYILFLLACIHNVWQAPLTDIDGLEFFAGMRSITSAFRKVGWCMIPFDLAYDRAMNWNSAGGMACGPKCV